MFAIVELFSDYKEGIEHVGEVNTFKEMLDCIYDVFQRHALLNELRARRKVHTKETRAEERRLSYINSVHHLELVLQSMEVNN